MPRKSFSSSAALKRAQVTAALDTRKEERESFLQHEMRGLRIIFTDWSAFLLIMTPIGLFWPGMNAECTFVVNFLAIIPQASIVFASIEVIGSHLGVRWGGMFDAFFGKCIEQVMCVQCMRAGLVQVLQGNLMGSLHWNLLLVLGMAIFLSGMFRSTTNFKPDGASAQMSCQIVAAIAIALPTMFRTISSTITDATVLHLSRIVAFATLTVYLLFIFFHFFTHVEHFDSHVGEKKKSDRLDRISAGQNESGDRKSPSDAREETLREALAQARSDTSTGSEGGGPPMLSLGLAFLILCFSIFLCGWSSQLLVNSIPVVSSKYGVPKAFIGVTLLPIIGNTAEHLAALSCAANGEMDLVIDIAIGSATQIALFVIPGAVLWGWMFDMPFTMDFRNFDATVMLASTFLVAQVLQAGYTNWLHGAMLMTTYVLIAIISWFIPE